MKENKNTSPLFENSEQKIENSIIEIQQPKHNFIIVYDTIYKNQNLNGYELALIIYLITRAPNYKPNQEGLMKALQFSQIKYKSAIKSLKDKGYLKIEKIKRNEYKYIVNQAPILRTINKDLSFESLSKTKDRNYYNELYKLNLIDDELFNKLNEDFYNMVKQDWIHKNK